MKKYPRSLPLNSYIDNMMLTFKGKQALKNELLKNYLRKKVNTNMNTLRQFCLQSPTSQN